MPATARAEPALGETRAIALLTAKAVEDGDQRIIRGTATTPSTDRMGDIIEPLGVRFTNPLVLLHQHDHTRPVGTVKLFKPTKSGVEFEARLPKIDEPGELRDRVETAWGEIKAGLVRAVSIGFRALEYSYIESGGIRFSEIEVYELSLVSVPANADCTIDSIKSIDRALLAASGKRRDGARHDAPGVSGRADRARGAVSIKPRDERKSTMDIGAQIAALLETRRQKEERQLEIQKAALDEGRTKDASEREEFERLRDEIKAIDDEVRDLRTLEAQKLATAKPVAGHSADAASASRDPAVSTVKVRRNVEKGIIFTRLVGARYLAHKSEGVLSPLDVARSKFGDTPEVEEILRLKTAIAAGTTTDANWAAPLVQLQNVTAEFIELLRPHTIIDRIPGLNRVPFNIQVGRGTADPTAYWVGEGKVKPVSAMAFDTVSMRFAKIAGIVAQTEELMRFSNPSSEMKVRDGLIAAVAYLSNRDFLDPTKAATDVSPASVTYGVTPFVSSGTSADALRADLGRMLDAYEDENSGDDTLVIVMSRKLAGRIGLMRNALGGKEFPDINRSGGFLEGIPVITSNNIVPGNQSSPADGGIIVAINASSIMLADDGGVEIDVSREATLQMNSTPDSPATGSTELVSLWQHNMVALKAERFINWTKARPGAVQFITGAKYE